MVKLGVLIGISSEMVHSEIAQTRSAGAGTAKYILLEVYDSIVTRQFCKCAKEALRATSVHATGTVRLLLSVWSECRKMRVRSAQYLRVKLLFLSTWKQNEQRSETVFELGRKKIMDQTSQ